MITDRANAICLLELLKEYSDSDNILGMKDILSKMQMIYGIKPDRRTIYSAIGILMDLGYDISTYEENGAGYFLRERDFEPSEILLLTDAVYAFPFIPAKQSEELIKKLQKQLSLPKRKNYRHLTIVRREKKTDNKQTFWNIDVLDNAIQERKQVSFTYLQFGINKRLLPRREKPYTVNPYGMVYMNEHYYLICNMCGYDKTSLYRIDRMKDISILDESWSRPFESKADIQDTIYAFTSAPEDIEMICDNVILDDVIDKFGSEVRIRSLR